MSSNPNTNLEKIKEFYNNPTTPPDDCYVSNTVKYGVITHFYLDTMNQVFRFNRNENKCIIRINREQKQYTTEYIDNIIDKNSGMLFQLSTVLKKEEIEFFEILQYLQDVITQDAEIYEDIKTRDDLTIFRIVKRIRINNVK